MFTEDMEPKRLPRSGFAKDSVEVEGYVRGFARRRPDVAVTTLRFANCLGPGIDTPLSAYFQLPVVPTVLRLRPAAAVRPRGRPARLPCGCATVTDHPGTYNVTGDGVILLSQAVHRAGTADAAAARPVRDRMTGGLVRRASRGSSTSRPSRSTSSPTGAASTPPGCGGCSASSRATRPRRRSTTSCLAGPEPAAARRHGSRRSSAGAGRSWTRARGHERRPHHPHRRPAAAQADDQAADGPRAVPGCRTSRRSREDPKPRGPRPTLASSRGRRSLDAKLASTWRSCAAGSPATTRSTTSATTPSSPTRSSWPGVPAALQALVPRRDPRPGERPRPTAAALIVAQPLGHDRHSTR